MLGCRLLSLPNQAVLYMRIEKSEIPATRTEEYRVLSQYVTKEFCVKRIDPSFMLFTDGMFVPYRTEAISSVTVESS